MPDKRTSMPIEQICFSGIYYLIKNGEVVYVGQATNVFTRIGIHIAKGEKFFDSFDYDRVSVEFLDERELMAIIEYNPRYNKALPKNNSYFTLGRIKSVLGIPMKGVRKYIVDQGLRDIHVCGQVFYIWNRDEETRS